MLGKLIKYEFHATARVMLPLFIALMALSLLANLSIHLMYSSSVVVINIIATIIMVLFVCAIIAVCIMAIVLMIQRFYKNLLTDEGYLTFTLPASVHNIVWSKIIVSVVWFVCTFAAVLLAILIATFKVAYVTGFTDFIKNMFNELTTYYALNGIAIIIEIIIVALLACTATCLLFYAAMSLGNSFNNHRGALTVVFFIALVIVSEIIGTIILLIPGPSLAFTSSSTASDIHVIMGISILSELICCALYYIITALSLQKRLNLE